MKISKTINSLFAIVIVLLSSCNTLQVASDYDKAVYFTKYKTFAFYKLKVSENVSQLNQERIIKAVKAELTKKGFVQNDENPDVLVNTTAILADKKSVSANTYGYGGYYRPYGWGSPSVTSFDVYEYKNGSLIIDIIDASNQQLIWQGTGNKDIDSPSKDPDTSIRTAVTTIMNGFPPGKQK